MFLFSIYTTKSEIVLQLESRFICRFKHSSRLDWEKYTTTSPQVLPEVSNYTTSAQMNITRLGVTPLMEIFLQVAKNEARY